MKKVLYATFVALSLVMVSMVYAASPKLGKGNPLVPGDPRFTGAPEFRPATAADTGIAVRGATSQVGDLLLTEDVNGTDLTRILAGGGLLPYAATSATLAAKTPGAVGEIVVCTDCTHKGPYFATVVAAGNYVFIANTTVTLSGQ